MTGLYVFLEYKSNKQNKYIKKVLYMIWAFALLIISMSCFVD